MILNHNYVAGLFDGEGWVSISKSRRKDINRPYCFQTYSHISMTSKDVIYYLKETYGGSIHIQKPRSHKHSIAYRWDIVGNQSLEFLNLVFPYLIVKKRQAIIAISFQNYRNNRKWLYAPLTDSEFNYYCRCFDLMIKANKKGPITLKA